MRRALLLVPTIGLLSGPALAERGSDGTLRLLYWQAVSGMNPYVFSSIKDSHAASVVLEPMASFNEAGVLVPRLAAEVPTVENGGVAEDLTRITWTLKPGLLWSDGSAVTSADMAFTIAYCTADKGACQNASIFEGIAGTEVVDALTLTITFETPRPVPYNIFVGQASPVLQQAQFAECLGEKAVQCSEENFNPIGTGPFMVTDFVPNDVVTLKANPNYRVPDQPAFAELVIKGGGDAAAAARAVIQTGEFDYAWNMQIEPEVLESMTGDDAPGELVSAFGSFIEIMIYNFTDWSPDKGKDRSTPAAGPHPYLTDPAVQKALSMAIDRAVLVEVGYGPAGKLACNLIAAPGHLVSTANDWCLAPDVEGARALLDEAGWIPGADGIREKDGVRLEAVYQTSTNSVRQGTQSLIKQMWREIGVETTLKNVPGSVYFAADADNTDNIWHFYADMQEYADYFDGTDPQAFLAYWTCDDIATPANGWTGGNGPRFCDATYDGLHDRLSRTGPLAERAEIIIEMNDILVQRGGVVPLVHRGFVSAKAKSLGGVEMNAWDSELWNIAEWHRQ